jgi:hypothetical protein
VFITHYKSQPLHLILCIVHIPTTYLPNIWLNVKLPIEVFFLPTDLNLFHVITAKDYWVKGTNYKASHYAVFSISFLVHLS